MVVPKATPIPALTQRDVHLTHVVDASDVHCEAHAHAKAAEETSAEALGRAAQGPRAWVLHGRPQLELQQTLATLRVAVDPLAGDEAAPRILAPCRRPVRASDAGRSGARLRLLVALGRLRDGADDLAALAADLGFANHRHLTTTFRAAFGASPRTMRTCVRDGRRAPFGE